MPKAAQPKQLDTKSLISAFGRDIHHIALYIPWMSQDEYDTLKLDIETHGIRTPIIKTSSGIVIDGRHRYIICEELGIECPSLTLNFDDEEDIARYVASVNLKRRHLTPGQIASAVAKLETIGSGRQKQPPVIENQPDNTNSENASAEAIKRPSIRASAKAAGVGHATVERAKKAQKSGIPAVNTALENGSIGANTAANISTLPKAKQPKALEKVLSPTKSKPNLAVVPSTAGPDLYNILRSLQDHQSKHSIEETFSSYPHDLREDLATKCNLLSLYLKDCADHQLSTMQTSETMLPAISTLQ